MPTPVHRILDLLEVLQSRDLVTAAELAERFGVDRRTVRRDITRLQAEGVPVVAVRGPHGGYRLRPGRTVPPLLLSDHEAMSVVLGLLVVDQLAVTDEVDSAAALDKVRRVLPDHVRVRAEALGAAIGFTGSARPDGERTSPETVLTLAEAIQHGRAVRLRYVDRSGARTDRDVQPSGIVVHGGRWYLSAHDDLRDDLRTFRLDRIVAVLPLDRPATVVMPDPVAAVHHGLSRDVWTHQGAVLVHADLATARAAVPATIGTVEEEEEGRVVLRAGVESLEGFARFLASIGPDVRVLAPEALREQVAALAARLGRAAAT